MRRRQANNSRLRCGKLSRRRLLRGLLALAAALFLMGTPASRAQGAIFRNTELRQLKKRQKKERKLERQQQKAMERVMGQHAQTPASRKRFKHDLKMQRQMLRNSQKSLVRRMKQNRAIRDRWHRSNSGASAR